MAQHDTPMTTALALPESPGELEGWGYEDLLAYAMGPLAAVLRHRDEIRLAGGLILHRLRSLAPSGEWGTHLGQVSEVWEISERTARRWLADAEAHYGLEPVAEVQARRDGQARRAIATKAAPVRTARPEKVKADAVIPPPAMPAVPRPSPVAKPEVPVYVQGSLGFDEALASETDAITAAAALAGKTPGEWVRWVVRSELARQSPRMRPPQARVGMATPKKPKK